MGVYYALYMVCGKGWPSTSIHSSIWVANFSINSVDFMRNICSQPYISRFIRQHALYIVNLIGPNIQAYSWTCTLYWNLIGPNIQAHSCRMAFCAVLLKSVMSNLILLRKAVKSTCPNNISMVNTYYFFIY